MPDLKNQQPESLTVAKPPAFRASFTDSVLKLPTPSLEIVVSELPPDSTIRRKCHVLIVEDERHIARLLDHVLRKEGYDVTVAHDAEKALEAMEFMTPDAILLDIVLPGISGLDFLRHIRASRQSAQIVVVVLSGHWFKHDDPTLADAGATAQCPKPIAPSRLIRKLQECGMPPLLPAAPVHSEPHSSDNIDGKDT